MAKTTKSKKLAPKKGPRPGVVQRVGDVVRTLEGEQVPAAELTHIAPALRPFAVRLDSLTRDPSNARLHGEQNLAAIRASLRRFGQQHLILFDARRTVRAGSGRHEAAGLEGWAWVAAAPTNLGGAELKAFAIADNRTAELADWYGEELDRQIAQLADELPDFSAADLGFDERQIDALLKGGGPAAHGFAADPAAHAGAREPAKPKEDRPGAGEDAPDFQPAGADDQSRLDQRKPVRCPNCYHEFVPPK